MALTARQEEAAALVAADQHTDRVICDAVGVRSRATLRNWARLPEFKARVEEHRAAMRAIVREKGIAVLENRVAALQDRWDRMRALIEARAKDPNAPQSVPGIETGLLAPIGSTKTGRPIYGLDVALLKEMREHERQAAQELGQWRERSEHTEVASIVITKITAVQPAIRELPEADDAP